MKTVLALILLITGILLVITCLKIGPGVPPPQYLPRLLIPEEDIFTNNCSDSAETNRTIRFVRTQQISDKNPALVPALSRYSSHAQYKSIATNSTMIIAVWYFDNEREYSQAQKNLLTYLAANGSTNSTEIMLDYPVLCTGNNVSGETKIPGADEKQKLLGTSYSGQSGSGIFLAISRPLMSERDDFFIQYYGLTELNGQDTNSSEVSDLITLNERPYSLKGTVGPLSYQAIRLSWEGDDPGHYTSRAMGRAGPGPLGARIAVFGTAGNQVIEKCSQLAKKSSHFPSEKRRQVWAGYSTRSLHGMGKSLLKLRSPAGKRL